MRASRLSAKPWVAAFAAVVVASGCSGGGGSTPAPTYTISGKITVATSVTVSLTGAASATATTDASGNYAFSGLANGAYTVTPSKAGFSFTPASRAVTVSGADAAGRDFVGQAIHSISGTVTGAASVTVSLSGAGSATTTTDGGGAYTFSGLTNGAYTVTPSKSGFTFAPVNRPVTMNGADVPGQDFVASPVVVGTHAISGTVTGSVVQGITVTLAGAAPGTTTTDAGGHYTFTGLSDGGYTVTPSMLDGTGSYHVFSPPRRLATVSGADVGSQDFAGLALASFESFSSGVVSAARWDSGEYHALLDTQSALLGSAIDAPTANTSYSTGLVVTPEAVTGRTTSVRTVVQITSSAVTGNAVGRAGIDLIFQPPRFRVASPDNLTEALFVRVALQDSAAGLVALRQVFACTVPDCTATQGVGTVSAGGAAWPAAGLTIARNTAYTLSISFNTAASQFTYSLQGGAYSTPVTATIDLSTVTSPPFTIDLSQANFFRTRLFTQVRGGAASGPGNGGSIEARFDDVAIGVGGGAPALFDDFNTGTSFDPARWTVGGESARIVSGALEILLQQRDSPAVANLTLNRDLAPAPSALQAQVTVLDWSQTGTGQVGDLIAQVSMTATDVSYSVARCNVAVCTGPGATGAGLTQVVPRTSLRTVTLGTAHTMLLRWDAASHLVVFQVDDLPPVAIDPTPGFAIVSAPHRVFWQVASHATAAGTGVDFTTGSTGAIRARFQDVRKL